MDTYDKNGLDRVEFYIDGALKSSDSEQLYGWTWNELAIGKHMIKATVYGVNGNTAIDKIIVRKFF